MTSWENTLSRENGGRSGGVFALSGIFPVCLGGWRFVSCGGFALGE